MTTPQDASLLLERLLTDASFRQDVMTGAASLPREFATIDRAQLEGTARQLRQDLIHKQFRGSGGILERYGATLKAALKDDGRPEGDALDAIFERFVASPAYRAYREWPRTGDGACLEEAFFRFAEAEALGDADVRENEFLIAVVRAVLLSPNPGFALPPEVRRGAGGAIVGIGRRGKEPFMVAATARGLVQGPVTALIAALVDGVEATTAAEVHGVDPRIAAEAVTRLRALGIVP